MVNNKEWPMLTLLLNTYAYAIVDIYNNLAREY